MDSMSKSFTRFPSATAAYHPATAAICGTSYFDRKYDSDTFDGMVREAAPRISGRLEDLINYFNRTGVRILAWETQNDANLGERKIVFVYIPPVFRRHSADHRWRRVISFIGKQCEMCFLTRDVDIVSFENGDDWYYIGDSLNLSPTSPSTRYTPYRQFAVREKFAGDIPDGPATELIRAERKFCQLLQHVNIPYFYSLF